MVNTKQHFKINNYFKNQQTMIIVYKIITFNFRSCALSNYTIDRIVRLRGYLLAIGTRNNTIVAYK